MAELKTIATPSRGTSRFLSLFTLALEIAETRLLETDDSEFVINILSGACSAAITPAGAAAAKFDNVGGRPDIFSGPPELLYAPRRSVCEITCTSGPLFAVIYTAPTDESPPPAHISDDAIRVVNSGASDWARTVYIAIDEKGPATRMMVGESDCPPGNWSSFPPHRHAADALPTETEMEELYYFQIDPPSGFAIGAIYQDPRNKQNTANLRIYRHGHAFDVPDGYHFIAPCPGYHIRYTWALGGKNRGFGAWIADPELAWLEKQKG